MTGIGQVKSLHDYFRAVFVCGDLLEMENNSIVSIALESGALASAQPWPTPPRQSPLGGPIKPSVMSWSGNMDKLLSIVH